MNSYDPIDDDAAEIKRLEMENDELRAELAAERKRREVAEKSLDAAEKSFRVNYDGVLEGLTIERATNDKLREALERLCAYVEVQAQQMPSPPMPLQKARAVLKETAS